MSREIVPAFGKTPTIREDSSSSKIHVTLVLSREGFGVKVIMDSAKDFNYNGKQHMHLEEELMLDRTKSESSYEAVIKRLVDENDGVVKYSRLVSGGAHLYGMLKKTEKELSTTRDLLEKTLY